jgi:hypothetical protein
MEGPSSIDNFHKIHKTTHISFWMKKEVFETLKVIKINASPGPDNFNVESYIDTWDLIGSNVMQHVEKLSNMYHASPY